MRQNGAVLLLTMHIVIPLSNLPRHCSHSPQQDAALVEALLQEGQAHLFEGWPPAGERDQAKRRLLAQLRHLDKSYAGGLRKYIQNARQLLHDSKEGG